MWVIIQKQVIHPTNRCWISLSLFKLSISIFASISAAAHAFLRSISTSSSSCFQTIFKLWNWCVSISIDYSHVKVSDIDTTLGDDHFANQWQTLRQLGSVTVWQDQY